MAHKVGHKKSVRKPGESAFTYKGSKTVAKIKNRTTQSRRARQISSTVVPKPKISKASSVREPGTKAVGKATTPAKITGNTYTPKPRKNQKSVRAVISKTPKPVKKQVHPKPSIRPSSKSSSVRPPVEKVSKPITKAKGTSPSGIAQVNVSKHTPKPSKKFKGVSPSGIAQVSVSNYIPPKSSGNKQHQEEDIAQVSTGQKERDPAKVAKSIYRAFFPTFRPEKKSKSAPSKPKTTTANMYAKKPGDQHPPAAAKIEAKKSTKPAPKVSVEKNPNKKADKLPPMPKAKTVAPTPGLKAPPNKAPAPPRKHSMAAPKSLNKSSSPTKASQDSGGEDSLEASFTRFMGRTFGSYSAASGVEGTSSESTVSSNNGDFSRKKKKK